jgi:predicted dehydrogenase
MKQNVTVGVVGIGFGQQVHVPAFRADGRCRVTALCASSAERSRQVADRLGVGSAYGDWRELVDDPQVQVVAIAVPPALQASIVIAAARAGKHVFCEKPAATCAAEAEAMLAAVEEAGVCHAIDFLFAELPAWRQARELLLSGRLGRLRHAHVTWRTEIHALRHRPNSWKLRGDDGGGALNAFVSHSLYYLEWLFGPVVGVAARLAPAWPACETQVDAWLELSCGAPLTLAVSADAYLGPGHRLEVYGDEGTLVLENTSRDHGHGWRLRFGTRGTGELQCIPLDENEAPAEAVPQNATRKAEGATNDGRLAPVARIVRRFVDGVLEEGPAEARHRRRSVVPNLHDGVRVQRLLDSLRAADLSRRNQAP